MTTKCVPQAINFESGDVVIQFIVWIKSITHLRRFYLIYLIGIISVFTSLLGLDIFWDIDIPSVYFRVYPDTMVYPI